MYDSLEPVVLYATSMKARYSNLDSSKTWLVPRLFYMIFWRRNLSKVYVEALSDDIGTDTGSRGRLSRRDRAKGKIIHHGDARGIKRADCSLL
jgi:hypothetical protein